MTTHAAQALLSTLPARPDPEPARPARGKQDPEGRRRAILTAAADLLAEVGPARLTHRMVAARAGVALGSTTQYFASIEQLREDALQYAAGEIEKYLDEIAPTITRIRTAPELFAHEYARFLEDPRQVQSDMALMSSATTEPRLREVALIWYDRLVELLTAEVGEARARIIAIFLDGAVVHAALHDLPLNTEQIAQAVRAILGTAES